MNKLEFLHWLQDYKSSLGHWKVNMLEEDFSQYTVGCFKDYETGEYKVYKNDEHSHKIRFITKNQSEAYDKLKGLVLYIVENSKGYI